MVASSPILLATDFSSGSQHAVAFAAMLGRTLDVRVVVLYVDVLHGPGDEFDAEEELGDVTRALSRSHIQEQLKIVEARLGAEDIDVETRCRHSLAVAPAILETADAVGAGMIVAGTHGTRGVRRFLLGSVSDELLRTTHHPLVLVPETERYQIRPVRRILVPIDFSPSSEHQLDNARVLATALEAEVQLLHINEPLPLPFMLPGVGTLSDLVPSLERQIEAEIEKRAADLRNAGILVHTSVVEGRAGARIIEVAETDGCDLILIARHGQSKVERLLLGSITERVTRTASTPVLVFPDPRAA